MKKLIALAAVAVLLIASTPAYATGEVICEAVDGTGATVDLGVGRLEVLAIISAHITANGKVWSTQPGKGETEIIVGQGARDRGWLVADFTDPNVERIIASLRLVSASEGDDYVLAGTLVIKGESAHALNCLEN